MMGGGAGIIGRLRAARAARCLGLAVFLSAVTSFPLLHNLRHDHVHSPSHGQGELEHFGAVYSGAEPFALTFVEAPAEAAPPCLPNPGPDLDLRSTPRQPRAPPVS